ncbi:hypothetical protein SKAU_G00137760 [Synaphobranchus kaupii]|uniref:RNase H type-1 domain-containing protein n=1 Tax=Synaphobranchus kaupii TaxID=118154 RepID=A0A9Q1FRL7_SYNKA|nr:hypothetical protein SKAU_G00137760 [Synaphobranchus kaupii]
MRQQGLRILNYLDYWLVCARSEEQCQHHVSLLVHHIQALEKSRLNPSQVTQFLGMVLDSRASFQSGWRGSTLGLVIWHRLISTDTSQEGWGAVHKGCGISERWRGSWTAQHLNVMELRAILLALQHFLPRLQGHHVLVRTDSTAAATYINRQGWLSPPLLCKLLDGTPWELPVRRDLLSQAGGSLFHPFPQGLQLWAWPLRRQGS